MKPILKLLLASTALMTPAVLAVANPLGPQVVGGNANVQGQGTSTVTVTQSTDRAIINWNSFNIGVGETTQFMQLGASSITLNRVTGSLGASSIDGNLFANGRIFLVNPDGMLFGANARINTAGFLATTSDIKNSDFMAGNYRFGIPGRPDASIVNQGIITAHSGGFAALVAPGVRNAGTITANLGSIGLSSGNAFTLDFYGDKLITLSPGDAIAAQVKDVATGLPLDALVKNNGRLRANGGKVELSSVAARQVVDAVINNTGVIEANTIGTKGGMVVLGAATAGNKPQGAPTQTVKVSGVLSAAGTSSGEKGGTVQITGENIELASATVNASGAAGGGTVLVGGDVGGGKGNATVASIPRAQLEAWSVPTASAVTVDIWSQIDASAKDIGNGGKVIVWSDQQTTFAGAILARGGTSGGSGGFVETSSHGNLDFRGMVDVSAPRGPRGTLLLDPLNAIIGGNISVVSVQSALATGDVIVSTDVAGGEAGDITVAANVNWQNASTLTLSANRNITVNTGVTIANIGAGNLALHADSAGTGVGTVNFIGTGKVDFSQSTGLVSIFYNPADNPAGSLVNATSYTSPANFTPFVLTNGAVPNQLTAYILVNSVYDLQNVNNNTTANYALARDIEASATVGWNGGAGFVPIGGGLVSNFKKFSGIFDGQGYAINGLTINFASNPFDNNLIALFAYVGDGTSGSVRNLGLTNVSIYSGALTEVLAGLAGANVGTISNSYVTGSVSGVGGVNFGGLVGNNSHGTISGSFASVQLVGPFTRFGGLVGINDFGSITQSYANGSVSGGVNAFGGLVGWNNGSISQSYSTTFVAGVPGGGLVGQQSGTTTNSYWDTQTSGKAASAAGTPKTTAELTSGLPAGFDPTVWGSNPSINGGYPYLKWQVAGPSPATTLSPTGGLPPPPQNPILSGAQYTSFQFSNQDANVNTIPINIDTRISQSISLIETQTTVFDWIKTRNAIAIDYVINNSEVRNQVEALMAKAAGLAMGGPVGKMAADFMLKLKDAWEINSEFRRGNIVGAAGDFFTKIILELFVDAFGVGVLDYTLDIGKIGTAAATTYIFGFFWGL